MLRGFFIQKKQQSKIPLDLFPRALIEEQLWCYPRSKDEEPNHVQLFLFPFLDLEQKESDDLLCKDLASYVLLLVLNINSKVLCLTEIICANKTICVPPEFSFAPLQYLFF